MIKCQAARRRAGESGQSLAEAAVILPILLSLLLGMADGAYVLQTFLSVVSASDVIASYASGGSPMIADTTTQNEALAAELRSGHCRDTAQTSVTRVDRVDAGGAAVKEVQVSVRCHAADLVGFFENIPVQWSVTRRMRGN